MNRRKRPVSLLLALATVLTLTPPAYAGKTATTIQLQKTEGTVTAANSAGRSLTLRENMQFYNGYSVDTNAKSYAWLNLDSSKLAKVDAVSKVEFRKKNKDLELLVSSGNIFFNVTEPLESDETMKVETSTFIAGIRGTCGWIECDSSSTTLNLLEGSVECQVLGQSQPVRVEAGQSVTFFTPSKTTDTKPVTTADIPGMVLVEVVDDTELCGKIQADSGLDLAALSMTEARRRLAEEEEAVAQAETAAAAAAAQNPTPVAAPAATPAPAADPNAYMAAYAEIVRQRHQEALTGEIASYRYHHDTYALLYINDDDIPELLCEHGFSSDQYSDNANLYLYTYMNGQAVELKPSDGFSRWLRKSVNYAPRENMVRVYDVVATGNGTMQIDFYSIGNDGSLQRDYRLDSVLANKSYKRDGSRISASEYNAALLDAPEEVRGSMSYTEILAQLGG